MRIVDVSFSYLLAAMVLLAGSAAAQPTPALTDGALQAQQSASGGQGQPVVPAAGAAQAAQVQPAAPAAQAPASPVVRQIQAPVPASAVQHDLPPRRRQVGDVTRLLFAAQADGRRAGGALPMLGEAATRSWHRYMESFSYPIPERFDERVEVD